MIFVAAITTSIVNAQCLGSTFFKGRSADFVSGLENICFEMSLEQVRKSSSAEDLSKLYNKYLKTGILPHEFGIDTLKFNNWFNDGGSEGFGGVYFPEWINGNQYEVLGSVNSSDFGIHSLYVVNRHTEDTIIAFSFYEGKSKKFYRLSNSKYEKTTPVTGLFDITMRLDAFMGTYFEKILDDIGYSRPCKADNKNCMIEEGRHSGRTVLNTNDPQVIIIMDPSNRTVHIRHTVNMNSLKEAMCENIKSKYTVTIKTKTTRLDE